MSNLATPPSGGTPATSRPGAATTALTPQVGQRAAATPQGVGKVSANEPRAPFCIGQVPRACWCNIETTFRHPTPSPEDFAEARGLAIPEGTSAAEFAARHGFGSEYATPETLAALVRRFNAQEGRGRGLCITRDHASHNDDMDSRAAGWVRRMEVEGSRLWAWVEWTPWGHAMVNGGEYIYFSTEYDYREFALGRDGAQPTHLTGVTITNEPRHEAQVPCTNSRRGHAPLAGYRVGINQHHTTMHTHATNTDTSGTPEDEQQQPITANAEPPKAKEACNSTQPTDKEGKPATNADPEETEALNEGEDAAGAEPLVEIATMLQLPETATPADVVAAVGNLQRSNEELQAALAEANKGQAPAAATNSRGRYPHLSLGLNRASKTQLNGSRPNREVNVRVGAGTRAVNTQSKAKTDYCSARVERKERALGRPLTPAEYSATHAEALRDYAAGVGM